MPRAFVLVLDSVGIGGAPDAASYGDPGADTVGHIAEACARGDGDQEGLRRGPLDLPRLVELGLGEACRLATGRMPPGLDASELRGRYGCAAETSRGKDTPSGHWEIAGCPVRSDWGYFPNTSPCFPPELIEALCREAKLPGILGNAHASGTEVIAALGDEHRRTGKPICYSSVDSVFQIAAHEEAFGLARLYEVCAVARRLLDPLNIGRVIARPFLGASSADFERTANRRDYAVPPPESTVLDCAEAAGRDIITVGKIADIFAHRATGRVLKAAGNSALFDRTIEGARALGDGGFLFANFIDFDSLYGHRRDVPGYAATLESFDRRLPELDAALRKDDLVIITADHGCDPTYHGTEHTREQAPVLAYGAVVPGPIGARASYADIAASVARHLGLPWTGPGRAF